MSKAANHTIQSTLEHSKARAEHCCTLNQHFGLTIWTNAHDTVTYEHQSHHTLSLYLKGGYSTRRLDQRSAGHGAPNKFCLLPAAHQSDWEIGESQRFAHLYFTDSILRHIALEEFDIDPRQVELQDSTYFQDEGLRQQYQRLINRNWETPYDRLALQEDALHLVAKLLLNYGVKPASPLRYRGGLTRPILQRVIDYIHAHIDEAINLNELADVAGMSPFHFSRMFKTSTGETPHQKVTDIRIDYAAKQLLQGHSQLQTALASGFANQSHFSRTFKKYYGVTPKQFLDVKHR